jgi:hypothetical protein
MKHHLQDIADKWHIIVSLNELAGQHKAGRDHEVPILVLRLRLTPELVEKQHGQVESL